MAGHTALRYTTSGEQLFFLVRDQILPSLGDSPAAWGSIREWVDNIGGTNGLHAYIQGAIAVHAVRRLLRMWDHAEAEIPVREDLRVSRASKLATLEVFPGLKADLAQRLARLILASANASGRPISVSMKKRVLADFRVYKCYLCDVRLGKTRSSDWEQLTLEHLWPTSLGGDSTEDNLLPACKKCQEAKADALSWEWINVHNIVLPPSPSASAFKSVPWPVRIARHHMQALSLSRAERISLKDSFIKIGPIKQLRSKSVQGPVTFFDLATTE